MMDGGKPKLESGAVESRRVLVVDPDSVFRVGLGELLMARGFTPISCSDADTAIRLLGRGSYVAIWAEAELEGRVDGIGLLERARERTPGALLLLVTSTDRPLGRRTMPEGVRAFTKKDANAAVQLLEARFASDDFVRIA
jgi:DNA-binding NtrC family response regulator